jgi:hypothetical protein
LAEALARKKESDLYSGLLEDVADALAARHPDAANLPTGWAGLYDHGPNRTNSLQLQEIIAGLRLQERAMLGQAFDEASRAVAGKAQGFMYRAGHLRFASGVGVRGRRLPEYPPVGPAGADGRAHVQPDDGLRQDAVLIVVDRDSDGYEVGLSRPIFSRH